MASLQSLLPLARRFPIAAVCVGLTVLTGAGYGYRFSTLDERQQELDRLRTDTETLRRNVRNAADLEEQLKRLAEGLAKLDARLVKETDLATNQERFYRIETETGVKMLVQQAAAGSRKTPPKLGLMPIAFNVVVDAPFVNALNFVNALERAPFDCRVVSFVFQPTSGNRDGEGAGERVMLNMQLELFGTP